MGSFHKVMAAAAACSMLALASPVQAQTADDAAKLRKLDIMLMVSSLRCRFGSDNFQADYEAFANNQTGMMKVAYQTLQADYTARLGANGAKKALDTLSVGMANQYGQGHPWLDCGDLKAMTQDLAGTADERLLLAVADDVLGDVPPSLSLASR